MVSARILFLFTYYVSFIFIFSQWLVITLIFVQRVRSQEFYELEDLLKAAEVGAAAAEAVTTVTTTSAPFLESLAEVIANVTSAEEGEPELEGSGSLALEEEETATMEAGGETVSTNVSTNPPLVQLVQLEDTRGPGFCTCMPCETDLKRTTLELKVRVFILSY